jgi:hypothetical protein
MGFRANTNNYLYTQRQDRIMTIQAYAAHKANGKLNLNHLNMN